ncbi:MAG: sporulation initiation factor Spo0A C-terminal domain-containing protein [Oscillospiraceae bacterium]|nr:sporulation initiation factor Spo0A C-terminal domain-containing protein [Oscillospiraceae bacterium]
MKKDVHISAKIEDEHIKAFQAAIEEIGAQYEAELNIRSFDNSISESEKLAVTSYVSDYFAKLGMPANLNGYSYLMSVVNIVLASPDSLRRKVTVELYPEVASLFHTKPASVERSIRHAISVVCDRGNYDFLVETFKATLAETTGKPTNSEFIAKIVELAKTNVLKIGVASASTHQ